MRGPKKQSKRLVIIADGSERQGYVDSNEVAIQGKFMVHLTDKDWNPLLYPDKKHKIVLKESNELEHKGFQD